MRREFTALVLVAAVAGTVYYFARHEEVSSANESRSTAGHSEASHHSAPLPSDTESAATERQGLKTSNRPLVEDARLGIFSRELGDTSIDVAALAFDTLDPARFAPLAQRVRTSGISLAQLRQSLTTMDDSDPIRPALLLAMAWAPSFNETDEIFLREEVRRQLDKLTPSESSGRAASALAAFHALNLAGRGEALSELALGMMRGVESPEYYSGLGRPEEYALRIAMGGASQLDSRDWNELLVKLTAPDVSGYLSRPAWGAIGRVAPPGQVMDAFEAARAGNGNARSALENVVDDRYTASLADLYSRAPQDVYGRYLRASAIRGMLNIGSPAANAHLQAMISESDESASALIDAMAGTESVDAIGTILDLSAKNPEMHSLGLAASKSAFQLARKAALLGYEHPSRQRISGRMEELVRSALANDSILESHLRVWLEFASPLEAERLSALIGSRPIPRDMRSKLAAIAGIGTMHK